VLTGASAQVTGVITLMVVGALLVVALNRRAATHAQHHSTDNRSIDR